jgi:hypothetical protein
MGLPPMADYVRMIGEMTGGAEVIVPGWTP